MRRRVATRRLLQALAAVAIVGLTTRVVLAVCGDANDDGNVSVSDGVQALRAAAGLGSTCDTDCDIDGSGAVTVSDGVNILRKAAGLATTDACPNADPVASLIGHTLDIFGPITKIGAVGGAGAAGSSSPCDNPEGGFQESASGFTFDDCQIGNVSFTGFLGRNDGTLDFSNLAVRRAGDVLTLQGQLSVGSVQGNPQLFGVLDCDSLMLGSYVVTYEGVVTDPQGKTLAGVLRFDTTDSSIPAAAEVRVTLTGGTSLPVVVTYDDESTADFTYNTTADVLTPVTGPTPTPRPTPPVASVRLSNIDDRITAFLNGKQVLQAQSTGPNGTNDTGFRVVDGLQCGDNRFDFVVENTLPGSGYTFRAELRLDDSVVVSRACGIAGVQGCDDNNTTQGVVARDVTFLCVPCGPCSASIAGTCANPLALPSSGRIQVHARTAGTGNLTTPCNGGGPESVFVFTPANGGCYEFGTCGTSFDSQLAFGDGICPGTSGPLVEQCFDGNQPCEDGSTRELTFALMSAGQRVTIVVDGAGGSQSGAYTLDVRPSGRCLF